MRMNWLIVAAILAVCLLAPQPALAQAQDQEATIVLRCLGPNDVTADANVTLQWSDGTTSGSVDLAVNCYGRDNWLNPCGEKGCRTVTASAPIPEGSKVIYWQAGVFVCWADPVQQCSKVDTQFGSSVPARIVVGPYEGRAATLVIE